MPVCCHAGARRLVFSTGFVLKGGGVFLKIEQVRRAALRNLLGAIQGGNAALG